MKISQTLLVILMAVILFTACAPKPTPEPFIAVTPSATDIPPTATATASPSPTETTQPIPTETPTPTPHPIVTMSAKVNVETLNLRAGPSTIYAILGSFPEDTELLVLSRVLGNEWVRVQMPDGTIGWMSAALLDIADQAPYLPLEEVTESILISGRVIDSNALPVNGINVAVLQRLTNANLRTDAKTNEDGYFYAFIPKESAGTWEAQVIGADCTSRILNENCELSEYYLYSYRVIFDIPLISPILFMYQAAETQIAGTLTDAEGKPANLRVFAERSDGAYAYVQSGEDGKFSIPAGQGFWTVYAIQYNPNLKGEPVSVQITAGETPQPIDLKAPSPES